MGLSPTCPRPGPPDRLVIAADATGDPPVALPRAGPDLAVKYGLKLGACQMSPERIEPVADFATIAGGQLAQEDRRAGQSEFFGDLGPNSPVQQVIRACYEL